MGGNDLPRLAAVPWPRRLVVIGGVELLADDLCQQPSSFADRVVGRELRIVLDRSQSTLSVDGDLNQQHFAGRLVVPVTAGFSRGRA